MIWICNKTIRLHSLIVDSFFLNDFDGKNEKFFEASMHIHLVKGTRPKLECLYTCQ